MKIFLNHLDIQKGMIKDGKWNMEYVKWKMLDGENILFEILFKLISASKKQIRYQVNI